MSKRAQGILLWTLLGSLVGTATTVIIESQKSAGFSLGIYAIVWLISSLVTAYFIQWLTDKDKESPYRLVVVFLGLLAPGLAIVILVVLLVVGIFALAEKAGRVSKQ